jgi:hypothetical protein
MKTTSVYDAATLVLKPEVQNLIKRISEYGLAVCVPHMHDEDTGDFLPLAPDTVQSESALKVSFVKRSNLNANDVPVAWQWNDDLSVIQTCQVCRPDGPHH